MMDWFCPDNITLRTLYWFANIPATQGRIVIDCEMRGEHV